MRSFLTVRAPVSSGPRPVAPSPRRRGFTVLELATVLLLASAVLAALAPAARRQADREAARAAREAVVGMVSFARAEALAAGGATLGLDPVGDSLWVEARGRVLRTVRLRPRRVDLDGGRPVRLRFDPLGLGRLSSRTVTLRRGDAASSLTLSAYGRVRRR